MSPMGKCRHGYMSHGHMSPNPGDLGETRNRSSGCTPAQAGVGRYVGSTGYDTKPSINDDQVDVVVGQAHTTSSLA